QHLRLDNSYARLPDNFYRRVLPSPQTETDAYLVSFNPAAAALIDLDVEQANNKAFLNIFSGRELLPDSDPIATVYCGHQFGVY
ncbi:MAG: hypothetical protein GWN80_08335, partial [Gammaproteobacteria bacterium]|nr:hypothetical protein [Gammaproteobacteria bacterium]